ncbi:tetratricopeptide (TPR) repeat protein [Lewinella marina]|uniref:RagB/SusD family nutrient uptake outer membrane protein n=1 Tax=Neolewinella marina TaxID=438751 RepID=A0A2G0CGZ6_9BACT|nr:RagB/SusD family nutrient uptake outer membrane protein [Neolewinella marina]NJB86274.1 tetratricopeptide (TPR) repeat protein [Neolewinella marina]PHK99254.1 RagB/SusD family nutrient uptake outer membrane protein [Neolewinella marina]
MQPYVIILLAALSLALTGCEIEEQFDPNGPSLSGVLNNATEVELDLLATGVEAGMRNGFTSYVTASGTIARELYIFDADPRNTEDLLGKEDLTLDANTFYITGPFGSRYAVVKNANVLLEAVANTDAVTEAEKQGYRAFANTIKAYMLSQVLDLLGDNGVRVDVADPENLGPFLGREAGYDAILALLDEAHGQLQGAEFAFTLSNGFAGFNTPATFARFNRAIAARVATHAGRYQQALAYVEDSFLDLDGDISVGPEHIFSTVAGDLLNPLFKAPGQSGDQIIVHPRIIENATNGDNRLNKFRRRVQSTSQDGLNGDFETALYASATSPIDIIRNEELILIYAEANINLGNLEEAVDALDVIRTAAGLDEYDGPETQEALIDEMLYQRCYSLWGEGHRMFDLRRYGRLNAQFLPIDRAGDDVFTKFPIPLSEGV